MAGAEAAYDVTAHPGRPRMPGPVSTWSSRDWCGCISGGRTPATSPRNGSYPRTAAWRARPAPGAPTRNVHQVC